MFNKCKFVIVPALILMIAISPYFVRAENENIKNTPEINKTGSTGGTGENSSEPVFNIKIQSNDSNWSQFDRMLIDWKIENSTFPAESIIYFEVIGSDPTSVDAVIYPISNLTLAETKSPLVWDIPKEILAGEYYLSAYVYTISSEPVLLSNSEGFYVERQVITSTPAKENNGMTNVVSGGGNNGKEELKPVKNTQMGTEKLVEQFDENNFVVSKRGIEDINKSIVELEKYLNELKERLKALKSVTDVSLPSVPTTTVSLTTVDTAPIGWSEDYLQMIDSDKDQLPDEIELIMGTDPNKADTDGDGYEDGLEVKNGYNPLTNEKTKVMASDLADLEGKIVSTSNEQGQKSNWLIKNGQKIFMTMPAT